jgi:type IV pilus assembly protein PilF
MRHEPMRLLAFVALVAIAGCASTGGGGTTQSTGSAGGTHTAMSNKGLANLNLAHNYMNSGKLDYAMDRANRALRSDPNSPDVQVVMGLIREKLGDNERAGQHYAQAVKQAPEAGHVLNVNAVWLCRQGAVEESDALFRRAVKDPFYKAKQQAYFNAGKCALQGGRLDRAEQYLRQGVELAPQDPLLLAQLAEVKFRQGDFMAARAFFQRRESLGAPSAELLDLAVRIEQGAGDTVAADRYRRRLNEQFPNYTPPAAEGTRQP